MEINKLSKKTKFILIGLGIFILGVFLLRELIHMLSAGSYAFSEDYEFNIGEKELIKVIEDFRNENPQYYPPFNVKSIEGRNGKEDYWYHFYFYYKEEKQILHCWVRGGTKMTTFAFVGVNDGLIFGNWKLVNDGFGFFENRRVIKKFEERILFKIKERLKVN